MGNGIVVVIGRRGDRFVRARRARDLARGASSTTPRASSRASTPSPATRDVAMVEERLEAHPALARLCTDGVPDVRVIVYRGVPGDER